MRIILCILLSVLFISCNADEESTAAAVPKEVKVIMPLAAGNAWTFDVETSTNTMTDTSRTTYTMSIQYRSTINVEYWYTASNGLMYTNRTSGLWEGSIASGASLYLSYPVKRGDTFTVGSAPAMLIHVLSTDSLITVPAGTFPCVVYLYQDSVTAIEHSYAVNVGEVRTRVRKWTDGKQSYYNQWLLRSYTLH